jgi:hypothetical protein
MQQSSIILKKFIIHIPSSSYHLYHGHLQHSHHQHQHLPIIMRAISPNNKARYNQLLTICYGIDANIFTPLNTKFKTDGSHKFDKTCKVFEPSCWLCDRK